MGGKGKREKEPTFGLHIQPCKTTRYTIKLMVVGGGGGGDGGGGKRALALFLSPHLQVFTCKFVDHIADYYENLHAEQTNKATTNIFGLHNQPRKTTRYTNIFQLV